MHQSNNMVGISILVYIFNCIIKRQYHLSRGPSAASNNVTANRAMASRPMSLRYFWYSDVAPIFSMSLRYSWYSQDTIQVPQTSLDPIPRLGKKWKRGLKWSERQLCLIRPNDEPTRISWPNVIPRIRKRLGAGRRVQGVPFYWTDSAHRRDGWPH